MGKLNDKQIEIRAEEIDRQIEELRKEKEKLNANHVYNCIDVINSILWVAIDKGLPVDGVRKLQTIIVHTLNFMNGNIPDTFCDFKSYIEEIRKMVWGGKENGQVKKM